MATSSGRAFSLRRRAKSAPRRGLGDLQQVDRARSRSCPARLRRGRPAGSSSASSRLAQLRPRGIDVGPSSGQQVRQREQRHLHLRRRGQAGDVVQRHLTAVGDEAVDELQLGHVRGHRSVAHLLSGAGRVVLRRQQLVEHVVVVDGDEADASPGGAEVLREGVQRDHVARQLGHRPTEPLHERRVDGVGDDDQVGTVVRDQLAQLGQPGRRQRPAVGVARVDDEERLDRRVAQPFEDRPRRSGGRRLPQRAPRRRSRNQRAPGSAGTA